jgi:hypothetical protein
LESERGKRGILNIDGDEVLDSVKEKNMTCYDSIPHPSMDTP